MAPNSETTDVKSWHPSGAVHIHLFFPLWMTECKNECYSVSLQTLNFVHADIPLLLSWTALSANLFSHFHRWDCSTTFLPNCIFLPSAFCHGVPLSPLHFYFHPPHFLSLTETWISVMMEFSYQLSPTEATLLSCSWAEKREYPSWMPPITHNSSITFFSEVYHSLMPASLHPFHQISHLRANFPLPWWFQICFRECQHPPLFWYSH